MRQVLLCLFILFACGVNAEQFRITGTVVDEVHEPIIFAKVEVKDADRRTVTNVDGNFSIDVEKGAILKFSYLGYYDKLVEVLNDSSLVIELEENPLEDLSDSVTFVIARSGPPAWLRDGMYRSVHESDSLRRAPKD